MAVEIEDVNPKTLPRAAQLTQKTNQFNLTTRRYTEDEMAAVGGPREPVDVALEEELPCPAPGERDLEHARKVLGWKPLDSADTAH